jgi:hypothetical protein
MVAANKTFVVEKYAERLNFAREQFFGLRPVFLDFWSEEFCCPTRLQ